MALVLPMFAASVHATNVNLNVTASWRGADKYPAHPPDGEKSADSTHRSPDLPGPPAGGLAKVPSGGT